MATVIVERLYRAPIAPEDQLRADLQFKSCLDVHDVRPRLHVLSEDGRRVFCVIDAPDAETVRRTAKDVPAPPPRCVWTATMHGPEQDDPATPWRPVTPARGQRLVAVERDFDEPAEFDLIQEKENRAAWCLELRDVSFARTYFALDRRRMICLYFGPDAESVRDANLQTGVPFTEVWPAQMLTSPLA